jgi:hypothetical protein
MMTTVHDSTVKEYAYFNAVKRPGASLKYSILAPATQAAESIRSTPSPQAAETIKTGQNRQL